MTQWLIKQPLNDLFRPLAFCGLFGLLWPFWPFWPFVVFLAFLAFCGLFGLLALSANVDEVECNSLGKSSAA
jgi:hypothetical protein